MFVETWRNHWGLTQDPFACEDADKDLILSRMDEAAVHSVFDRLFGDPRSPAPGIVFGEKGSGKSGLRLTMSRRIRAWNKSHADAQVFATEYNDFDGYLEMFRRNVGAKVDDKEVARAVHAKWATSDHLDAMLSLGVTQLVDDVLDEGRKAELTAKQKTDLLMLVALYHDSRARTTPDAVSKLRSLIGLHSVRAGMLATLRILLTIVAAALALMPYLGPKLELDLPGVPMVWYVAGATVFAATWLHALYEWVRLKMAGQAVRRIRVLSRDPKTLEDVLKGLPKRQREDALLPSGSDEATRYDLVARFTSILAAWGYEAWYVLLDRVDEPSALNADPNGARRFVEKVLDHKLLQMPGLALKLFLPIELDEIYRNATPEELKRMRLDKSNLVHNLDWTGQELIEIASQRLRACLEPNARAWNLGDFFAEDVSPDYLKETLQAMGTPRFAMGFLAALFLEYARNLPGELAEDAAEWRVPRASLDVVRSAWVERSNLLRRKLN